MPGRRLLGCAGRRHFRSARYAVMRASQPVFLAGRQSDVSGSVGTVSASPASAPHHPPPHHGLPLLQASCSRRLRDDWSRAGKLRHLPAHCPAARGSAPRVRSHRDLPALVLRVQVSGHNALTKPGRSSQRSISAWVAAWPLAVDEPAHRHAFLVLGDTGPAPCQSPPAVILEDLHDGTQSPRGRTFHVTLRAVDDLDLAPDDASGRKCGIRSPAILERLATTGSLTTVTRRALTTAPTSGDADASATRASRPAVSRQMSQSVWKSPTRLPSLSMMAYRTTLSSPSKSGVSDDGSPSSAPFVPLSRHAPP